MKEQTIDDYFNIARSMAKNHVAHPVYPQRDDIVQEAMLQLSKDNVRVKKHPMSVLFYSMKNTYIRKTEPELNKSYLQDQYQERVHGKQEYKTIDDKIAFKEFMAWLPTERLKDMFTKRLIQGIEMSDIAKEYGVTRQILYVHYHGALTEYKKHIGVIHGK